MSIAEEIERKFLVDRHLLGELPAGVRIQQAYLPTRDRSAVRVRVSGEQAWLTLKGENRGARRLEFEYAIPRSDAEQMIAELCSGPVIDKTRYGIEHAGYTWEVDLFHGDNEGLIVAEVELGSEHETPELPAWVTEEVTGVAKYYNANLLHHPFCQW